MHGCYRRPGGWCRGFGAKILDPSSGRRATGVTCRAGRHPDAYGTVTYGSGTYEGVGSDTPNVQEAITWLPPPDRS
ncbi:hypothetical protein GCM10009583_11720 [Ornithinicoccus hortensis]